MRLKEGSHWILWSSVGALVVGALLTVGYVVGASNSPAPPGVAIFDGSISQCMREHFALTKAAAVDSRMIGDVSALCYSQIHGQGLLNDFQIRRLKFVQQAYDERILLWLVVALTFAGVAFAGIQLMASYHLAVHGRGSFGDTQELSIENSRISLKSSITGLFILVFSFAFFTVFVFEIYKIKEIDADGGKTQQVSEVNRSERVGRLKDAVHQQPSGTPAVHTEKSKVQP